MLGSSPYKTVSLGLRAFALGVCGAFVAQAEPLHLGDELIGSARTRGLAGAAISGDDGYTAALINPAFIGVGKGASDSIFAVKQLTFPYLQVGADAVSFTDNQNIAATKPDQIRLEKLALGPLRQGYVDASAMPSIVIGRSFVGYIMHQEAILGAKANFDPNDRAAPALGLRYRQHSGPVVGIAHGTSALQLGVMGAYLSQSFVEGEFSFDEIDTPTARKAAFGPKSRDFKGVYSMVGLSYVFYPAWSMSLSAVAHNPGGTTFEGASTYVIPPNYQAALALRPRLAKWLTMATTIQLDHESGIVGAERLKGSVEWLLGKDRNGKKDFAIRVGYNKVGLGFGAKANLGLVGIEYAHDIVPFTSSVASPYSAPGSPPSTGGEWAAGSAGIERRSVSLSINVADF